MIKSENGRTEMRGTRKELLMDYFSITQGMAENMGKDIAKEIIPAFVAYALSGAVSDPEILEKSVSEGAVS